MSFLCDSNAGCAEPLHSGTLSSVTLMRFLRFLSSAILCFLRFPQQLRHAQRGAPV
jgi:hypothetical protein